jgi:tetratricopeptide (TPR) repeat protein
MFIILSYVIFGLISLWGLWNASTASTVFLVIAGIIEAFVFIISRERLSPLPEYNLTSREAEFFRKYSMYFRYGYTSRQWSSILSTINLASFFWIPWLIYQQQWIQAVIFVVNFFLVTRLVIITNPRHYFHERVERTKDNSCLDDMITVDTICDKITKYNLDKIEKAADGSKADEALSQAAKAVMVGLYGNHTEIKSGQDARSKAYSLKPRKRLGWGKKILIGVSLVALLLFALVVLGPPGKAPQTTNKNDWLESGKSLFASENYTDALNAFNKAVETDPNNSDCYFARGRTQMHLREFSKAIADLNQAITINPREPYYYAIRGYSYKNLQMYDLALTDFNKAIEINPKFGGAYLGRGEIYSEKENYQKAIEDMDTAMKLDPATANANAYALRGFAHGYSGNNSQALSDCNKAIELDPKLTNAYYCRAKAYMYQDDYRKVIENVDVVISAYPKAAEMYQLRGYCYRMLGNADMVISDCKKAIELDPNLPKPYYEIAIAYSKKGDERQAVQNMKTAARMGMELAQETLKKKGITW